MANHNIKVPKEYTEGIRKFEPTDKGHADVFNAVIEPLVNNDAYAKEKLDKIEAPTYTASSTLEELSSGESIFKALGKLSKAVSDLITHLKDKINHLTAEERISWNKAVDHANNAHAPSNAEKNIIVAIQKNGVDVITNSSRKVNIAVPVKVSELENDKGYKTIDTTYADMTGASPSITGKSGLAPAPTAGAANRYLRSDGVWQVPPDTNTTYGAATASATGLMSAADKGKLDGIATSANNYAHPINSGNKHIPAGGSSGQFLKWSADGTAVWGADNNTTYGAATASATGLMSATDKGKLDGVATGATKSPISNSAAVTATGTYALDAVQANASVSGTMANKITALTNNFTNMSSKVNDSCMRRVYTACFGVASIIRIDWKTAVDAVSGYGNHGEYMIYVCGPNVLSNVWINGGAQVMFVISPIMGVGISVNGFQGGGYSYNKDNGGMVDINLLIANADTNNTFVHVMALRNN